MVEQYITYQHNVQKYFREHSKKYTGVIIPLSIAVSFPTGTYGFIRALCSKHNLRYAIDPRTPLFQRDWGRNHVRPPHEKMADIFGEPFVSKGLKNRIDPSDLAEASVKKNLTEKCIEFQMDFRTREEDVRKLNKYKKLLDISTLENLGVPQFVIPPYFLFETIGDSWFNINCDCIRISNDMNTGIPIQPVFHFKDWPAIKTWNAVIDFLKDLKVISFWLYPDFYKEHEVSRKSLVSYREIVETIASQGLRPYALFGGYYAILMSYFGLCGFGNGIGYGEWRSSNYHRGGTAINRIYIPKLHRYLDAPTAQHIIDKDTAYFSSGSSFLSKCVSSGKKLTDSNISLSECLNHFMECRYAELKFVANNPIEIAIGELQETYSHLKKIGPQELENFGNSLDRWQLALNSG